MLSSPLEQTVQLKNSQIKILNKDIFFVLYQKDVHLELSDFKEARAIFEEWSANRNLKLLVEFPNFTSVSSQARDFAEKNPIAAIAEAIVYKSLAQRILVRFYLLVNRQNHPVRAFRNRARAIAWLSTID